MARSDYATLTVDEKGNPTSGSFVSPSGVQVESYKTWLYIRDVKAWTEGCGYSEPTVMEVRSGSIDYKDIHILAVDGGPQGGIYFAVWSGWGEDLKAMIGIGVYGYDDSLGPNWIGITQESMEHLRKMVLGESVMYEGVGHFSTNLPLEKVLKDYGDKIIDYKEEEGWRSFRYKEEYEIWSTDIPMELQNLDLSKAGHFNQGDAYFVSQGVVESLEMSPPGESGSEPIAMQLIKGMRTE